MVLQKRLDYGFNGYQVPVMPRASRSVRRRRLFKKKVEDTQMYAFDLLATVAGELLLEKNKESKPSFSNVSVGRDQFPIRKDSIKQEEREEERPFKQEPCDQGSCDESASFFRIGSQRHGPNHATKQCSHTEDSTLVLASVITKCETPEGITCAESMIGESRKEYEKFPCTNHEKCHAKTGFLGCAELHDRAKDELERQQKVEQRTGSIINGMVPDMFSLEDPVHMDAKPSALVSSDSSVDVPFSGTHNPCSSFTRCLDDAKVVSRDDDDNSSGCTQHVTPTLKSFRPPCHGDWRIRKLLASKYWKATPKILKHGERSNSEMFPKPLFRSRKACYTRQRTQRYSFKRRKLFERTSVSPTSDGKISGISVKATDLASRVPFPVIAHKSSLEARDSHVKLRIKSIRVPELLIEIPETATIGSLKRMVVEAVTAVLGGGLRVGVLLQGKKIRDDNKTLLHFGISHDDKLDGLGFSLEPTTPVPPSVLPCPEDSYCLLPCDSNQPLSSCPPIPISDAVVTEAASNGPVPPLVDSGCYSERGQDSVPSPDMSLEKTTPDSKALVAIPSMNVEALAVVPLDKKSKRSELVQRRIRRPFSVSEVEALVQAVEKLGTGRWRDVKLCAFENAKHRTYVDLKDKWKTLVHTARISPQQRRGEPVPQALLDRVLSAHGYWSQQQKKQQQIKPPLPH